MPRLLLPLFFFLLFVSSAEAKVGTVAILQTEGENAKEVPLLIDREGGRISLPPGNWQAGEKIKIDKRSRLIKTIKPAPRWSPRGKKGALIVSIGWSGYPATDVENYSDLTAWSRDASDGRFIWSPVSSATLTLDKQPTCNEDSWSSAAIKKLQSQGYKIYDDYGALGIIVPKGAPSDCVGTAYAYVGCFLNKQDSACGMSFYSSEYTNYSTVVHELGHTVGLGHASTSPCAEEGSPVSLSYSGQCELIEYGDRFDPMGTSWRGSLFHPLFAREIGWLDDDAAYVPLNGSAQNISLSPYGALGASRAAFVPLPPAWNESSPGELGLEFKTNSGFDSLLYSPRCSPNEGLFIRMSRGAIGDLESYPVSSDSSSVLIDTRPETSDICDAALQPGESWQDPTGQLRINFLSKDASANVLIETPLLTPTSVSLKEPRKKTTRNKGFVFWVQSSRLASQISKDDFFFKGPSRGCKITLYSSEDWQFKNESITVRRCRPGRVQVGMRAGALRDEFFLSAPATDLLLPPMKILPRKRR